MWLIRGTCLVLDLPVASLLQFRMTKEVTAPNTEVYIEVIGERQIPNGVIHLITVQITDLVQQRIFSLAEEMVKRKFGAPIGKGNGSRAQAWNS